MLEDYNAASGTFVPIWTLEIQTPRADVDKILDAVMVVNPLLYGRYERNASVSAEGMETAQPMANSTTTTHVEGFGIGQTETYPMVVLTIHLERDTDMLARVMDVIHDMHHYEEPVILLREDWASRAAYNPDNDNPNRWWNNGRGMPNRIDKIS